MYKKVYFCASRNAKEIIAPNRMKRFITFLVFTICVSHLFAGVPDSISVSTNPINKDSCTYKGVPLHGRVKMVNSFADFKVRVVQSFPDLNVKVVNSFPDHCGEWMFVESFPDFTIQYVNSFADFDIKFVNSFPGVQ